MLIYTNHVNVAQQDKTTSFIFILLLTWTHVNTGDMLALAFRY